MIQEKMKDLFVRIHTKSHAHFIIYFTLLYNLYIYIYVYIHRYVLIYVLYTYTYIYRYVLIYRYLSAVFKGRERKETRGKSSISFFSFSSFFYFNFNKCTFVIIDRFVISGNFF